MTSVEILRSLRAWHSQNLRRLITEYPGRYVIVKYGGSPGSYPFVLICPDKTAFEKERKKLARRHGANFVAERIPSKMPQKRPLAANPSRKSTVTNIPLSKARKFLNRSK